MDIQRVVVKLSETEHRVLDPADVYFLAGAGGRTRFLTTPRTGLSEGQTDG
jgi:hypothetical protein